MHLRVASRHILNKLGLSCITAMPLKRKFNLKNLGKWIGVKKRKKNEQGNKENIDPNPQSPRRSIESTVTAESIHGWEEEEPPADVDDEPIDDSDDEAEDREEKKGIYVFPPTIAEADKAFLDLKNVLKPPRKAGDGYRDPGLDKLTIE
ncbi:hypothetical protein Hypma_013356 [Hypsizygus marmoreus]|uniref:Uncharacterized protein n=1 Tax=Hypsizygus marmoreus TaxID=39966 RepID=A0A369JJH6_HYPMA|nr:hypothetical protein Hypma_013356 [Hypsizygus marmoreus]